MKANKELIDCTECGSSDVGASSHIAHCYSCGHAIIAETTDMAVKKWNGQSKDKDTAWLDPL